MTVAELLQEGSALHPEGIVHRSANQDQAGGPNTVSSLPWTPDVPPHEQNTAPASASVDELASARDAARMRRLTRPPRRLNGRSQVAPSRRCLRPGCFYP